MKKLLLVISVLTFCFGFSQSKKTKFINLPKETLYKMFSNSVASKEIYDTETEKERQKRFQQYFCMIKNYKRDFSDDSNFASKKDIEQIVKKDSIENGGGKPESMTAVEYYDIIYRLQMTSYTNRLGFYQENKKCLKKESFDW